MLYVLIQFAMVLFHESHHLIILGLPSFVLCHILSVCLQRYKVFFKIANYPQNNWRYQI